MLCDLTWPCDRLFCGDDLGNGVNDDVLSKAFSRFSSFNMARIELSLIFVLAVLLVKTTAKASKDDDEGR
nr:RNA-binding protein 42-like isoform X1 [Ipomoea trifida]